MIVNQSFARNVFGDRNPVVSESVLEEGR